MRRRQSLVPCHFGELTKAPGETLIPIKHGIEVTPHEKASPCRGVLSRTIKSIAAGDFFLAYILPDILISILWLLSSLIGYDLDRWLWPFAKQGGAAGMLNALAVTALILLITGLATRWKIILKL